MVFQLPVFLVFVALSSWFYPTADRVVLEESYNGSLVRTFYIEHDKSRNTHVVKMVPLGQTSTKATVLGEFTRTGGEVSWTLGQGTGAITKMMRLSDKVSNFSELKPNRSKAIQVAGLGAFKVTREPNGIQLSTTSGQSYRFAVQKTVLPTETTGEIGVQTAGKMLGWRVYPKRLTLADLKEDDSANEPGKAVLTFVNDLKTKSGKATSMLSKTMLATLRQSFERHIDRIGLKIERIDVIAYVKSSDIERHKPKQTDLIKGLLKTFGPADVVVFAEFNGPTNDAFFLLERSGNTFTIKALISRFFEELIPADMR